MATRVTQLELVELSLVDRPANPGARVVLHKSAPDIVALLKSVDDQRARSFAEVLADSEKWRRQAEAQQEFWPVYDAMMTSINSIMGDAALEMSQKVVRVNESLDQFLATLREKVPVVEAEIAKALEEAVAKAGDSNEVDDRGDGHMPGDDVKKVADLEKSVSDLGTQKTALEKSLSDLEKKHAAAEAEIAQLKKDAEVAKTDEVVKIAGVEMRKSVVGDATFAVVKAQAAETAELQKRLELSAFEKSAEASWPMLPGTPAEKAVVAKAVAGLPEDVRKSLETMLLSGNTAMVDMTKTRGQRGEIAKSSPEGQLEVLAKALLAKEPALGTFEKAYAAVAETPEGRALYEQSLGAARSVN